MSVTLYELAGAEDDRRFSPFCWRVRMALLHKGLAFEALPWRFTDKAAIAFSGQEKVPVIVDGDRVVCDSWKIALYLEETYPDRPSLFGGPAGLALSRFATDWVERTVMPGLFRMYVADILAHVHPRDRDYFRASREKMIGTTLEAYVADRDARLAPFRDSLAPLRATLGRQPFLAGDAPGWADYAAFGPFQWVRSISATPAIEADDKIWAWRERLLDAFDGNARKFLAYPG